MKSVSLCIAFLWLVNSWPAAAEQLVADGAQTPVFGGTYIGSLARTRAQARGALDCTSLASDTIYLQLVVSKVRGRWAASLASVQGWEKGRVMPVADGFTSIFSFTDENGFLREITVALRRVKKKRAEASYRETASWPAGGNCLFVYSGPVKRS